MNYLLFIRHVETLKNSKKEFSKLDRNDSLTKKGEYQADELVRFIKRFIDKYNLKKISVYTSFSSRSVDSAQLICDEIESPLKKVDGLTSFDLGEIGGLSESEAEALYPLFSSQLKLYRNGLLNSYSINYPDSAENPHAFETRVNKGINEVLNFSEDDLKIIVLHRSVLTATYISIARRNYGYPKDYYGFVPVDNGYVTLVRRENEFSRILFVNERPENLY